MATAYVKGGMPLEVEGTVESGGSNAYPSDEPAWTDIEVTGIYWHSTGKPVTTKFQDSLSADDWEAIEQAIYEECCE